MNHFLPSLLLAAVISTGVVYAQPSTPGNSSQDSINRALERQISELKTLKISGYVQTEWQRFSQTSSVGGRALYSDPRRNFFTIRRGRLKFQHRFSENMTAVLQPDITETGVRIKDAYAQFTLLPSSELAVTAGMFNRPNYEVELSSSTRESIERSQVVRAFYPNERDLGVMFSTRHKLFDGFSPKLQLGIFNGVGTDPEVDAYKDIITRLTFPIPFEKGSAIRADLGASFYYGGIPQLGDSIVTTVDGAKATIVNDETGDWRGWGNRRNFNVEAQIYLDMLPFGATTIKGEFLTGQRPTAVVAGRRIDTVNFLPAVTARPLQLRNQMGYYAYFIQNLGSMFQIAVKYDYFDRNADMSSSQVTSFDDAAYGVMGLGANITVDNMRVTLWHELPMVGSGENGPEDIHDDKSTVRFQYKF